MTEKDLIDIPCGYKKVEGGFTQPGYLVWCLEEGFQPISPTGATYSRVDTYLCVIEPIGHKG